MTGNSVRGLLPGAVVAGFGVFVAAIALSYPLGSAFRPGPGFVPLGVGVLLVILGICVAVEGVLKGSARQETADETGRTVPTWRPVAATVVGILMFALLLDRVGYVPSSMLLVLITAQGEPRKNILVDLAIAVFMALFGTIVFIWGLGLPIEPFVGI